MDSSMNKVKSKSFLQKTKNSLAKRVFYSSLVLLGLPLLVHTMFLYDQEYKEKIQDTFSSLEDLASGDVLYFEQMVRYQQGSLAALAKDPTLFQKDMLQDIGEGEFFSLSWQDGKLVCPDEICCLCLETASKQSSFVVIDSNAHPKKIYVGKTDPSSHQVIIISTSVDQFFNHLALFGNAGYPTRISFLDAKDSVLLSTDAELEGKTLLLTQALKNESSRYFITSQEKSLAVKLPLAKTAYSILLDVQKKEISGLQVKNFAIRIGGFFLTIVFLGGGLLFLLTQRFARPFLSFSSCMQSVAEGDVCKRFQKDSMGFEINDLGIQFNQMLDTMRAHAEEIEKERLAKELLAEELRIGRVIQSSMLPTSLPEIPSVVVAVGYLPAKEVSGDFYDLFVLEDGRLLIVMADAADKGISACLYSLSFRSMLRASSWVGKDLAKVVQAANLLLMKDTVSSNLFITAWIAIFDPNTRELSYCSQGHPPAYLCTDQGEVRELSHGGLALGIEDVSPRVEKLVLSPQDLIVLYTDGVIEAEDSRSKFYGSSRLDVFLRKNYCKKPQEVVEALLEELRDFCSDVPQADDITLLAFSIREVY